MAYSTTLDQKRRETLRRQLYGKEVIHEKQSHSTFSYNDSPKSNSPETSLHSITYLTSDLRRIFIFSVIAVAAQLALYFAINHHLVKLPI